MGEREEKGGSCGRAGGRRVLGGGEGQVYDGERESEGLITSEERRRQFMKYQRTVLK